MYRVYTRYYGDLVEDISGYENGGNEEFEEIENGVFEDLGETKQCFKNTILKLQKDFEKAFEDKLIVDEESYLSNNDIDTFINNFKDKNNVILFRGFQENWDSYIEVVYEICKNTEDYLIKKIEQYLFKKQNFMFEYKEENLIDEISLIRQFKGFLENNKTSNIKIENKYLEKMLENKDTFIEDLIEVYYNYSLGNSYNDIKIYLEELYD